MPKKITTNKLKKRRVDTFSTYLYRVLKEVHTDISISKRAINIMNSIMHDIFERLAREGSSLARLNKKRTLTSR